MTPVDLATATTDELAEEFLRQQARYRQRLPVDERAGLELFRRAIQQREERAWELLYPPCRALLLQWLRQNPWADLVLQYESPEGFVLEALAKFWQAITRTRLFQERPTTLADILAYLRRCLHSVLLDAARQARARAAEVSVDALAALAARGQAELSGEELWRSIERALPDQRERRLVYLRYVLDYRPREIVALAPEEFPEVEHVYQLERQILQRLRRHPALAHWKQ
jgi:DNA-directed RNA polymerase specialized sigma24 family protein